MEKKNDKDIVEKVLSGDTEAFATLVNKYSTQVFSLINRISGNRETAEELTQDTFMKAYKNLKKFKGNSSFSTWLYRIAYNTAISQIRKKKHEHNLEVWDNISASSAETCFYDNEPDNDTFQQMADIMEKSLNLLSADEKTLITLFYKDDLQLKDIAVIMSLSETNTKTKLFRTRKKLASIYKNMEDKT